MNSTRNNSPGAQIPDAIIQAYLGTTYSAQTAVGRVTLKIGVRSDELMRLFATSGANCAALVTAENPYSEFQTPATNAERQGRLGDDLTALGVTYFPGKGQGEDPSWPAEASSYRTTCATPSPELRQLLTEAISLGQAI